MGRLRLPDWDVWPMLRGRRSLVRKVVRKLLPRHRGPAILMYHRVAAPAVDPWGLSVSPGHFSEHLDVLSRHRRVLALDEFAERHARGQLPEDAVAITFDDGYLDNLTDAHPRLERHGTPATVFLVTGMTGAGREFWHDELARLVLRGETSAAAAATVRIGDRDFRFEPGGGRDGRARRRAHAEIWGILHGADRAALDGALQALRGVFSGPTPPPVEADRPMTEAEVRRIAAGGLVRIGAHTVSHPSLPTLSPARRAREIADSREACLALAGEAASRCFAYPFGDVDRPTRESVERLGFAAAVTTDMRAVRRGDDPFALPRLHIRDCDGGAFARMLGVRTAAPRSRRQGAPDPRPGARPAA